MAFTDAEKVQIRKYCGYMAFGSTPIANFAWRYSVQYGDMEFRISNMTSDEETEVRTTYLANLVLLEQDIPGTRGNIDTARAAVWYRNPNELRERWAIFDDWRRRLCDFIGADYGPGLLRRGLRIVA